MDNLDFKKDNSDIGVNDKINVEEKIDELVEEIRSQNFGGTDEEIKIQQILYFDRYVKEHIDYAFAALSYQDNLLKQGITRIDSNPYKSAFLDEGFFKENEHGQRFAVCGSISSVANKVLNKLGIKCSYVYGHINMGTPENPHCVGHRWNIVELGNKQYMLDFTMAMVIHNKDKNEDYREDVLRVIDSDDLKSEYSYLFTDSLGTKEIIDGFKIEANGKVNHDAMDLQNAITDPYQKYPNLGRKQESEFLNIGRKKDKASWFNESSNIVEQSPSITQSSETIQSKRINSVSSFKTKENFDSRSQSELQTANKLKEKNMIIKQQKAQQKNLDKPLSKILTRKSNTNSESSAGGYANLEILALIVSSIATILNILIYYICK